MSDDLERVVAGLSSEQRAGLLRLDETGAVGDYVALSLYRARLIKTVEVRSRDGLNIRVRRDISDLGRAVLTELRKMASPTQRDEGE